jgi:hypothetical protein
MLAEIHAGVADCARPADPGCIRLIMVAADRLGVPWREILNRAGHDAYCVSKDPELHANALEEARQGGSVTTARRLCHFLEQVFVDTGGFTSMVENLNYRDPARLDALCSAVHGIGDDRALGRGGAEAVANRNGDEVSGDGWRYRGSGYKRLTGRTNYHEIGDAVHLDLEASRTSPGARGRGQGRVWRVLAHLGLSRSGQSPGPASPEPRSAAP